MRLFKPVGETRERICITISDIWVRKKFELACSQFRPNNSGLTWVEPITDQKHP